MADAKVTWRQVRRWRWRRQLLAGPAPDAVAVARRVCGIHAQVPSTSVLVAGVRTGGPPRLERLLWDDRSLVRTWAMRGALHLLPADELDLWVGALADRESRRRFPPSWERAQGVTAAQQHAITDAVGEVLGATEMSRLQLARAIVARVGAPGVIGPLIENWGTLLRPAAARGLLLTAQIGEPGSRFLSPAAWLGRELAPPEPAAANREVLLRFLAANGPATAEDVARWWGEGPAPARGWIRDSADALAAVEVEGEGGYVVRGEDVDELADTPDAPTGDVALLPAADPWALAPRSHRDRAVPAERAAAVSRGSGGVPPVLVADGEVVGTWTHRRWERTRRAEITVTPFAPLSKRVLAGAHWHGNRYGPLLRARRVDVLVPA
jgi:winged helix DNA-binding protein